MLAHFTETFEVGHLVATVCRIAANRPCRTTPGSRQASRRITLAARQLLLDWDGCAAKRAQRTAL